MTHQLLFDHRYYYRWFVFSNMVIILLEQRQFWIESTVSCLQHSPYHKWFESEAKISLLKHVQMFRLLLDTEGKFKHSAYLTS